MRSSVSSLRAEVRVRALAPFVGLMLLTALSLWPALVRAQSLPDLSSISRMR